MSLFKFLANESNIGDVPIFNEDEHCSYVLMQLYPFSNDIVSIPIYTFN